MKELILRNRNDFREVVCDLINWSNSKRIAEIGIWRGELSRKIIERCSPIYLLLVDPLKVENNKIGTYQCTMGESIKTQEELDKIADSIYALKAHFIRKPSVEAAATIPDKSLDFVFIDAIHLYEYIVEDIKTWLPKIKLGGVLAGDDYNTEKHGEQVRRALRDVIGNVRSIDRVWYKVI